MELLFLDDDAFCKFPFELFKTLVSVGSNEFRMLDAIVFLLRRDIPKNPHFPPNAIQMQDIIQDCPDDVFE
jgi:hypothetical protein